MVRGWLAVLAVLVGIGVSFAADSGSPLSNEKRWEEARKFLAEGKPAEAKVAFEELLGKYPQEADLHLFLGITLLRLREPQAAEAAVKERLPLTRIMSKPGPCWAGSTRRSMVILTQPLRNTRRCWSCAPILPRPIITSAWRKNAKENWTKPR